jgi:hypothetical protein
MTDTTDILYRELDHRITDGLEVRLLWRPFDDALHVTMYDTRTSAPSSTHRPRPPRTSRPLELTQARPSRWSAVRRARHVRPGSGYLSGT